MLWLYLFGMSIILAFGLVVLVGPPYLPTLKEQTGIALTMLELLPGQTLLELGSGDGRVMLAAAARGYKVVGIELNPLLVLYSRAVTWRYRKQVRIIWGNYFTVRWPDADAIFVFALPRLMPRLDARVTAWHQRPLKLVSFAFAVPGKRVARQKKGVLLYEYA